MADRNKQFHVIVYAKHSFFVDAKNAEDARAYGRAFVESMSGVGELTVRSTALDISVVNKGAAEGRGHPA